LANAALKELSLLFAQMYSEVRWPSIPPERLLEAFFLMALHTARSKRLVDERLPGSRRITLAGDRGYDTHAFIASCGALTVIPHVAQNQARPSDSALDAHIARHPDHAISQWIRKQGEKAFGRMKTIGGLRKTRYSGHERVQLRAFSVAIIYNLVRIAISAQLPNEHLHDNLRADRRSAKIKPCATDSRVSLTISL